MIGNGFSLFDPLGGFTDAMMDLVKLGIVVTVLLVVGLFLLSGKLAAVPKPWSLIGGAGCIIGAIYLVYRGGF
jgi:hypothetical protein